MRSLLMVLAVSALTGPGVPVMAQEMPADRQAPLDTYIRVLSTHFRLPQTEVRILTEGRVPADELPVALRLARFSGIPPVSLLAQRRSGDSWLVIARRYNLGAASFHVAIPDGQVDPSVARVHGLFRDSPPSQWDAINLTDAEFIALANLLVLSSEIGVSHGQILEARAAAGSFVGALSRVSAPR
jgi:hypothetical protein